MVQNKIAEKTIVNKCYRRVTSYRPYCARIKVKAEKENTFSTRPKKPSNRPSYRNTSTYASHTVRQYDWKNCSSFGMIWIWSSMHCNCVHMCLLTLIFAPIHNNSTSKSSGVIIKAPICNLMHISFYGCCNSCCRKHWTVKWKDHTLDVTSGARAQFTYRAHHHRHEPMI